MLTTLVPLFFFINILENLEFRKPIPTVPFKTVFSIYARSYRL